MRSTCGVSRNVICRYSDVKERYGLKEDVVTKLERGMLRRFGHLEKMNENRHTKEMYRANVCDGKVDDKGRPRKWYADQIGGILKKGQILSTRIRRACMKRSMDVSEAREICKHCTMWKCIVSAYASGRWALRKERPRPRPARKRLNQAPLMNFVDLECCLILNSNLTRAPAACRSVLRGAAACNSLFWERIQALVSMRIFTPSTPPAPPLHLVPPLTNDRKDERM
ncbi:hypothetical protein EVAR_5525_1 [Eumeta japonica]|uniref:Uncharacterized protein n=1 Tax=Eumeta variegata TaxID=151549 RepID=A0A4C1T8W1_EUMVA|nr:hypothetical protein EVAR_5525_1 [Eumeta japonica]